MARSGVAVLVIRADANPSIGTGHLMRSLALGEAWRDAGGNVTFVTTCARETILQRLDREGFSVRQIKAQHPDPRDLKDTLKIARSEAADWVSLDGYFFDVGYHDEVTKSGHSLLVFDDNAHLPRYGVDVLLNQNLHAENLVYHTRPDTKKLLGVKFVVLRREFTSRRTPVPRHEAVARRVLITLGGSDPRDFTSRVITDLDGAAVEGLELTAVVGPDNPHLPTVQRTASLAHLPVHVVSNADSVADLMSAADLAISGGGTTLWELAFLGVPTIAVIMADNQRQAVDVLTSRGVLQSVIELDRVDRHLMRHKVESLARDPVARARMAHAGQELVDGLGAKRVLKSLAAFGEDT